jgi:hypothetical protein
VFPKNWNHSIGKIIQKVYKEKVTEKPVTKEVVA